jgi:regulator of extracellular matrix RemA (YlzA/DUF370 family)
LIKKSQQDDNDIESQQEDDDDETWENELYTNEETPLTKAPSKRVQKNHPESHIIGDKNVGVETRRKLVFDSEQAMLSMIEPKSFKESNKSKYWIKSMDEELDQIEKN